MLFIFEHLNCILYFVYIRSEPLTEYRKPRLMLIAKWGGAFNVSLLSEEEKNYHYYLSEQIITFLVS